MTARRAAVFLDRDGTINEEVDFVRTPEELVLIPGAAAAIRRLNQAGFVTCVISNQSGVARGFYTEGDLTGIHRKLESDLAADGGRIDRIYYCPHHPTKGIPPYDVVCECRKPAPGMLLRGSRELDIDLSRSFVVGDRDVDIQVGKAVGARAILVLTGYGRRTREEIAGTGIVPDLVAADLPEAVTHILQEHDHRP
ncbi:MAG: family hydrolase [Bacteroidetes bacterium]|nr:family hydrolase [Bacteroidota bacterium]